MERDSHAGAPMVEVVDASVTRLHSHRVVASHVDWRVNAEEFWLVGGPHAAGKTAFVFTVAGLAPPAAGEVRVFGEILSSLREPELLKQRTRIGFVFKGGGRMFAELTVAENIALPLRYHRQCTDDQTGQRVNEILEATELTDEADSSAQTLGWARQQRLGLARALALNPELLFLDEPLSGLEARDRNWWRNFLKTLSQGSNLTEGRKMTLIATTNDFGSWAGEDHHRGLLQDGRWKPYGDGKEYPDML